MSILTAFLNVLFILCAPYLQFANALADKHSEYHRIDNASLCIREPFVESHIAAFSNLICACLCSRNQRCQAFSLADGPCQLFVFDKCSKSVRSCSCSRRGQVFVKRQPGREAGALCPSGYGDDLCGVKYKFYFGIGTWLPSKRMCEAGGNLVIMADIDDSQEMTHVKKVYKGTFLDNGYNTISFWLGGFQLPGSNEPTGGWYWVGCNISMTGGPFWCPSQPGNDDSRGENAAGFHYSCTGVTDFYENSIKPTAVLCECVSPF